MRSKLCIALTALAIITCSFDEGFMKTARGLFYKIHTTTPGSIKIKEGDYVKFNLTYKTDKDSILNSTKPNEPAAAIVKLDTVMDRAKVMDALLLLSKGDSATFKVSADDLFRGAPEGTPRPDFLQSGRFMVYTVKVVDVKTPQQLEAERKANAAKLKLTQDNAIAKYAAAHKLKLLTTPSGLRYAITLKSLKGTTPKAGDTVKVHYTGKFLDDKKFDASYDRNEPIEFPLGQKYVIAGWDEGLRFVKKGEKAVLVIPSALAYGERGRPGIPENSVLVFNIEMVDIKANKSAITEVKKKK
ncbi:FKBP-type peptidyl-prolyl cis-trans isomerase [Solitalea koreensis]|uniref:Peptidyl-prolyl cis-trans isomerase n=1 Tax=Solitalea koreensis TaxID=543615 RepID=A0A521CIS8_9SPHI|nr:FKBP-type peptidyl-prolyl cis-trans isomerase [Solitalea koreensis]SMO59285.1 FKBP-type peptidyl-prolyl cis-trans isomerase [Solitalea koreensis]